MAGERRTHSQRLQSVRRNSRQGASLVIVICASALLLAFALAMVYTASLMMARANRRLEQERCYQLAKSFAEVLEYELGKYSDPGDPAAADSFYLYACKFLEGDYGEYDPDHPDETVFHYSAGEMGGLDENYGSIRVALYKEVNQDPEENIIPEGNIENDAEISEEIGKKQGARLQRYIFTVEVVSTLGDVSCHYTTEYRQNATYEMEFTHNGAVIKWNGGNDPGRPWLDVSNMEYSVPDNDYIKYRYKTDFKNIRSCSFEKAYGTTAEGGDPP